ncbi:glycosyltransferase family 4 protein [Sphingomonas sp. ID1715]|uniref:glycosyltransferase family 4 protein n=1 Tax=Sphingomonas sp. ID1715 TaxID=1656898 RepID=UPI001487A03D|nr:glycosyltransferase family 4 protein [Sphingomonas sp. ID1715]NNM78754.1 glycosyltransferase family 4 protein [Sphingomonas sp. ID1715]
MTRILLTADTVGGVWQYATDLASGLKELGLEPIIVTLGPRPSAAQRIAADVQLIETDLPLDWLAVGPSELTEAAEGIARIADRCRADVVQLNAPALAATVRFDQPVVAVAHSCVGTWWQAVRGGRIDPDLGWRADLTAEGLAAADAVVAPSGAFAAMLQHCYGLERTPQVVRNGRRAVAGAVAEQPQPYAFTAGRLWDEGKNIAVLDRAAALTHVPVRAAGPVHGPNGAGVAVSHLQALGSLDEAGIRAALAQCPVFVSSAVYEPFGLAVLEAAQAGCALVLSDIPTFRELWEGAACFVYPHDAAGFARAIEQIIADPALRTRLAHAAQTRARDYTVDRMAAGMAAIYPSLPVAAPELVAA